MVGSIGSRFVGMRLVLDERVAGLARREGALRRAFPWSVTDRRTPPTVVRRSS